MMVNSDARWLLKKSSIPLRDLGFQGHDAPGRETRDMKIPTMIAAGLAAAAVMATATPAQATGLKTAEDLRKLDIMLMVTSLRCRTGADNFQADYRKFSSNHLATLNSAGRQLRTNLQKQHGTKGAMRALDKMSVGMANEYGNGHPWLGCAQLKLVTKQLTEETNPQQLALAADELLRTRPTGRLALATQ